MRQKSMITIITIITVFLFLGLLSTTNSVNAAAYYTFEMTAPVSSKDLVYSDDDITIRFNFPAKEIVRLPFVLYNKTNLPINIDWNQISFVAPNGKTMRIYHSGILYVDAHGGKQLNPTLLPPKARVDDYYLT